MKGWQYPIHHEQRLFTRAGFNCKKCLGQIDWIKFQSVVFGSGKKVGSSIPNWQGFYFSYQSMSLRKKHSFVCHDPVQSPTFFYNQKSG